MWLLVVSAAGPTSLPGQTGAPPRYDAAGLDCARFEEVSRSEIVTQTARRAGEGSTGRRGIWRFRARDTTAAVMVEAWYDSLTVWRHTDAGDLRPDTDGLIGGRYRGRLGPSGRYDPAARPFIPDEVAEVVDLATALDDLLPPLPPAPLPAGGSWRGPGLEITRLADTTLGGRRALRLALHARHQAAEAVPRGDTVPIPLDQTTTEDGTVLWDPAIGLIARRREIVVEATIPAGGRVRFPVRSRVVQHITLTRLPADTSGCR